MAEKQSETRSEALVRARNAVNTPAQPPPPHEQTVGAIHGADPKVAEEYAKTGKTPEKAAKAAAGPPPAPVNPGTGPTPTAPTPTPARTTGGEDDPVADMNATDAVDAVSRMKSKDKLQAIADNDTRVSVKEAAKARLKELG